MLYKASAVFIELFVCLRLYIPVNNVSIILGRLLEFNYSEPL